jgi:hypothetical protein
VSDHQTLLISGRLRRTLVILVGIFAAAGAAATLYLGLGMLGTQLQPETRKAQDLVRVVEVGVLFVAGMTACVGVGAGLGGLVLSNGLARSAFGVAIALTLVGLGCAVAALR